MSAASPGRILSRMPDADHELWEYAASNRARLDSIEAEMARLRDRQHELSSEVAAMRHLGNQVGKLADQVAVVAANVSELSRRVVERPTAPTMQAWAGWFALLIALAALVITATH